MKFDKYKLTKYDYEKHCFVELVTTNICNQHCWYCHWNDTVQQSSNNMITLEQFHKVCNFIEAQNRETLEFNFYGGEPTINPNLIQMVLELNERFGNKLLITTILTNFSKPVEYYESISHLKSLRLICSYHSSEVKDSNDWFKRIEKMNNNIEEIRLVLTQHNYKHIINIYNEQLNKNFSDKMIIHIIDQLPIDEASNYLKDVKNIRKVFKDTDIASHQNNSSVEIISEGKLIDPKLCLNIDNFRGMLCSAGFVILTNGDVLKCWKDLNNRKLLNIFKDDIYKMNVWEMCRYKHCSCDERFTKKSIKEFIKNGT